MSVNIITSSLAPYPMEELAVVRSRLIKEGKDVYDFGTGDPKIPLWPKVNEVIRESLPDILQYPSIKGGEELLEAHSVYLKNRFNMDLGDKLITLPTRGSKEAVFHIALSLVGRLGRKTIVYPDPGYPVYKTSVQYAGGIPYPVALSAEEDYLLCPWNLPEEVQKDCAAVWVNYPHNPTGAVANDVYWQELVSWAKRQDVVILSDDCYVDIFDPKLENLPALQPKIPLQFAHENVISFFSLSKRSGFTGYRCGMMVGDKNILGPVTKARANMGLGQPEFMQKAASLAWRDEEHVKERRAIFDRRMKIAIAALKEIGWLDHDPVATFYIWANIDNMQKNDIEVVRDLAELGIITTPGQWLGHQQSNRVRFAMVPDEAETKTAFDIIAKYAKGKK